MVDFKEWLAYKIQLHGIEWIVSLSANWDQSPTKQKKSSVYLKFRDVLGLNFYACPYRVQLVHGNSSPQVSVIKLLTFNILFFDL